MMRTSLKVLGIAMMAASFSRVNSTTLAHLSRNLGHDENADLNKIWKDDSYLEL